MKKTIYLILFLIAAYSCKGDKYTIGGYVTNYMNGEPISDITVNIYIPTQDKAVISVPEGQKLLYQCVTNKNGYYSFEINDDNAPLDRYNGFFIKQEPFDSTKNEWKYYAPIYLYESYVLGYGLSKDHYKFELIPSGLVKFIITNQNDRDIIIKSGNITTHNLKGSSEWPLSYDFALEPSRFHKFEFYNNNNGDEQFLESRDIYIKNSYTQDSKPGDEKLTIDTIKIELK